MSRIMRLKSEWREAYDAIIELENPLDDSDEEVLPALSKRSTICSDNEFEDEWCEDDNVTIKLERLDSDEELPRSDITFGESGFEEEEIPDSKVQFEETKHLLKSAQTIECSNQNRRQCDVSVTQLSEEPCSFVCNKCSNVFSDKKLFYSHKTYDCQRYSGKTFHKLTTKFQLGKRDFFCKGCSYKTTYRSNLTRHERTKHSNNKTNHSNALQTEHSYSLNSDGDSVPDSPNSLQSKIDDYETSISSKMALIKSPSSKHSNDTKPLNNIGVNNIRANSPTMPNSMTIDCFEADVIDTSTVKEEPLSPVSSCPPSPNASFQSSISSSMGIVSDNTRTSIVSPQQQPTINQTAQQFVNLANVAVCKNTDLGFEHNNKNSILKLSPASQSLPKSQLIILNGLKRRIVMPKINMPTEAQGLVLPSSRFSEDSKDNQNAQGNTASSLPSARFSSSISPNEIELKKQQTAPINNSKNGTNETSSTVGSEKNVGKLIKQIRAPLNPLEKQTDRFKLTEEEIQTLIEEGHPVPTRLPLTKSEQILLKQARRKIKNRMSAQKCRQKKKEYTDELKHQVEELVSQNTSYLKRIEALEETNANLMDRLVKMQAIIDRRTVKSKETSMFFY